ncbi:MAG TPA: ribose-5-phosphate isomerase RpiA [Thermoleophilaceae bacterium]|nr:ribose-5-phosphate isomerase RpiA [Thermoleophilaceae bacterium]
MSEDTARAAAAAAAADLVEPGMTVGLGSGRAVWKLVELLGARVRAGGDLAAGALRAASASSQTERLAASLGIELIELDGNVELDLALDGADEVDPQLRLIKGGGGALLREKIVISAARRFVVVAETPKKVERLGEHFRLPVEVVRFAWRDTRRRVTAVLPDAVQRLGEDGEAYVTDEGHFILDCALPAAVDLDALGPRLKQIPGVVEHGLFIGLAERALLGRPDGGVELLLPG